MADSVINVSGSDQAYAVDAIRPGAGTGDYRQVICVGDFTNSGISGAVASVSTSALCVSSVGTSVQGTTQSYVTLDLSAGGDIPAGDTQLVAAPGAGKALLVFGYQIASIGNHAGADGQLVITDGTDTGTNRIISIRNAGIGTNVFEQTFAYPVQLTTNTALKYQAWENSNGVFMQGTIYYTTITI